MGYTWPGMKKLSWEEVQHIHKTTGLTGYFILYSDETESEIDADYKWSDIEDLYMKGAEFGYELQHMADI